MVEGRQVGSIALDEYSAIVMVGGSYSRLPSSFAESIKSFVRQGGTLITMSSAIRWAKDQEIRRIHLRLGMEFLNFHQAPAEEQL